jgi:hypothetical protein
MDPIMFIKYLYFMRDAYSLNARYKQFQKRDINNFCAKTKAFKVQNK